MEGERPKISVIVPVYNVEAYVERCLASLAAQTYPHVEVVMVDDASTDGGGRICDAWAAREEGFHVVHLQENQGVSAARNEGSHRASGAYIAFVDSDDYVEPNLLERLYQALTEGQGDVSVCGDVGLGLRAGPARVLAPAEAARCLARRTPFLWTPWGKLFPAELVKETPFDKRVLCGEDLLCFYQILNCLCAGPPLPLRIPGGQPDQQRRDGEALRGALRPGPGLPGRRREFSGGGGLFSADCAGYRCPLGDADGGEWRGGQPPGLFEAVPE